MEEPHAEQRHRHIVRKSHNVAHGLVLENAQIGGAIEERFILSLSLCILPTDSER